MCEMVRRGASAVRRGCAGLCAALQGCGNGAEIKVTAVTDVSETDVLSRWLIDARWGVAQLKTFSL